MNKTLRAAVVAGVISGYTEQVLQNLSGPGYVLTDMRDAYKDLFRDLPNAPVPRDYETHRDYVIAKKKWDFRRSWKELADCGWCLAPYIAIPVFSVVKKSTANRERGLVHWMIGAATATSVSAFIRHLAEMF